MIQVGATLYTFSKQAGFAQQLPDTLAALADMGYTKVEAFLSDMQSMPQVFAESPVPVCGAHTVPGDIAGTDAVQKVLHQCRCSDICCSGPLEWNSRTPDDYRRTAERLNELGTAFAAEGVRLHYHNHEFEFVAFGDGTLPIDLLAAYLDPRAVTFCFDTGWPALVGNDPVQYLSKLSAQTGYVHLRDFAGRTSVPLGAGGLDLGPVLEGVRALPCARHVVVEQDPDTRDPEGDMRQSREYLLKFLGTQQVDRR